MASDKKQKLQMGTRAGRAFKDLPMVSYSCPSSLTTHRLPSLQDREMNVNCVKRKPVGTVHILAQTMTGTSCLLVLHIFLCLNQNHV